MFENFGTIGVDNITAVDIVKGAGSFFVVAIGGTVIGKWPPLISLSLFSLALLVHRCDVGIPDRTRDSIHGSCACYRANFHFRHGLLGLPECRNLPHERHFSVSPVK